MSARLVFLSGDLEGAVVSLLDQGFTIGRDPEEDLVLPDEVVSRLQASLRYRDGQYVIRDEASTNGTFVNDRRITEQVLHDGDVIEYGLGGPSARFEAVSPAQGARAARDPEARAEGAARGSTSPATFKDPLDASPSGPPGGATGVFYHERGAGSEPRRKRPLAIAVALLAIAVLIAVVAIFTLAA